MVLLRWPVTVMGVLAMSVAACTSSGEPPTTMTGGDGGSNVVLTDVSELVEAVESSVVTVTLTQLQPDELGDAMEVPAGAGTGVVIDADGHVLTNAHVVAGALSVIVVGSDGEPRSAQVVGTWGADQNNDLALLLLDEKSGLEPIAMGSSDDLEVGDPAVAIGNALGLGLSVSVGIVSAKDRDITTDTSSLEGVLQTDAAINPGNSGGPLLNARGELVGINTATARGGVNIGFAIPIDQALPFIRYVVAEAGQPYIGVGLRTITPQLAGQFGLPVDQGVVITEVLGGSTAAEAGLVPGDIVVAVGETPISSRDDLLQDIEEVGVGGTLVVRVMRVVPDGVEMNDVTVEVGAR